MSLRIPNGFRLKISKSDYDSFKKEIKEYLYPFLLKELSTELYKKCFDDFYVAKEEVNNEMWNEITEQLKKQVDIKKYKTEGAYAYVLLLSVRRENEEKVKI